MGLDLMTTDEVAKLLNLPVNTVRRMAQREDLPGFKINGSLWRFDKGEILAWIKSGKNRESLNCHKRE